MHWRDLAPRFSGRIDRRSFFLGHLALFGLELALVLLLLVAGFMIASALPDRQPSQAPLQIAAEPLGLVLAIWSAALYARRFHDLGWPSLLAACPFALAVLGHSIRIVDALGGPTLLEGPPPTGQVVSSIVVFGGGLLFVSAAVLPGDRKANRYGAPPPARGAEFPLPDRSLFAGGHAREPAA